MAYTAAEMETIVKLFKNEVMRTEKLSPYAFLTGYFGAMVVSILKESPESVQKDFMMQLVHASEAMSKKETEK